MATFFPSDFEFNFHNPGSGAIRHRRRSSVRYHPWTFEQRTNSLVNDINASRWDRLVSLPQNVHPRRQSRRRKEILPTWISREVKEDVYKAVHIIEERLQYHRVNFMATQDICALMWMQILEEAIPMLKERIEEAAALEGLRDVVMTDAPPLIYTDEDDDWIMDL